MGKSCIIMIICKNMYIIFRKLFDLVSSSIIITGRLQARCQFKTKLCRLGNDAKVQNV